MLMLPDAIITAPVFECLPERDGFLSMNHRPIECPGCHAMHFFFIVRQRRDGKGWIYRCLGCDPA